MTYLSLALPHGLYSAAALRDESLHGLCCDVFLGCSKGFFHYYKNSLLSRFHMAICPGFGTGIRRLLSRVVEPGQNVPRAKKYLRPVGLEPKTY